MGGASRSSAKQHLESKHHQPDHNGDVRNVSPANDAEVVHIRDLVDESENGLDTPSAVSVPSEQSTPYARQLCQTEQRSQGKHEPAPIVKQTTGNFLKRPDSGGSDVRNDGFNFAPANHKGPNLSRSKSQRPTPPKLANEQANADTQPQEQNAHHNSQCPVTEVNRRPLGRPMPPQTNDAPPLSFQANALVSSVEQDETVDDDDANRAQDNDEEPENKSEMGGTGECNTSHRASSFEAIQHEDFDQTHSVASQEADASTDHEIVGSAAAQKGHRESTQGQEEAVSEVNDVADHEEEMEDDSLVDQIVHDPKTPAATEALSQMVPSTPAANRTRRVHSLVVPIHGMPPRVTKRVTKPQNFIARSSSRQAEDGLSDENLLEILIVRHQQQKAQAHKDSAAADKFKTRIRTLNHSLLQLQGEKDNFEKNLHATTDSAKQFGQDNESLRGELQASAGRYRKLKDFAKSMACDMKALKRDADGQKLGLSEVKGEVKLEQEQAQANVSNAHSLLKRHVTELSSIRQETNTVFAALHNTEVERDQKSARLEDEMARNRRLEDHVTVLKTVQQQHNKAAREGDQRLHDALSDFAKRFTGLETLVQAEPQVPTALTDCLKLLQDINTRDRVSPTDFGNLKNMVDALDTTITKSVEKLDETLKVPQVPDNREVKKLLKQLRNTIDSAAEKEKELRTAETELARFEQKVESNQELIEEIRQAKDTAKSHVKTFQKSNATLIELSKAQQHESSTQQNGSNEELTQMRLKWQSVSSNLKTCQQERDKALVDTERFQTSMKALQQELEQETQKKQDLLQQSGAQRKHHEESVKSIQNDLDAEIQQRNEDISALQTSLDEEKETAKTLLQNLEQKKSEHKRAMEDRDSRAKATRDLQQQHDDLTARMSKTSQELDQYKTKAQQLEDLQQQHAILHKEAEQLKKEHGRLIEYEQKATALQQALISRDQEVTTLEDQLQHAIESAKQVGVLQNQLNVLGETQLELQTSLKASKEEANRVTALQKQMDAALAKVTDLESKLNSANQKGREHEQTSLKNAFLNKKLHDAEAQLDAARRRLEAEGTLQGLLQEKDSDIAALRQKVGDAEAKLEDQGKLNDLIRQKEQSITNLQEETKEVAELKVNLEELKKACEEKDANIRQLNSEISHHKEESQQLGELSSQITQQFPEALQAIFQDIRLTQSSGPSQERRGSQLMAGASQLTLNAELELTEDVDFSQPLAPIQHYQVANADVDGTGFQAAQPRRRVADRSGIMKLPRKSIMRPLSAASQPLSTGSTNLVPNSQIETPDETLEFANRGDASSSLSDLESDHSPTDEEGSEGRDISRGGGDLNRKSQRTRFEVQISSQSEASPERPSTAQTDLFNVHTNGLSEATARTLGGKNNSSPDSLFGTNPARLYPDSALPKTVAPMDLQLKGGDMLRRSHLDQISPRRLRDGTQLGGPTQLSGGRPSTPMPEDRANSSNIPNATPAPRRDKPMPNSAAKRTLEGEGESGQEASTNKRLKRNHANLEIAKPGPKPTPATPAPSSTSSGSRKGGSIIGTNAPAPGGAKKPNKAPRKPSKKDKKDKYVGRFGTQQESQQSSQ